MFAPDANGAATLPANGISVAAPIPGPAWRDGVTVDGCAKCAAEERICDACVNELVYEATGNG